MTTYQAYSPEREADGRLTARSNEIQEAERAARALAELEAAAAPSGRSDEPPALGLAEPHIGSGVTTRVTEEPDT